MYLFLIYSFQIVSLIFAQDPVHVCDPFPANPSGPPLPFLPDAFSTRVEINLDGVKSSDVLVNFDFNRRKAAIVLQNENLETKLVFDYPTNEIHVVEKNANDTLGPLQPGDPNRFRTPRTCKSVPLDSSDSPNYYFGVNKVNSTYYIPNEPLDLFHLNFPQTYSKRIPIRGIPCDCFLSCVYRPETKQNFTLEFCFSVTGHLLPGVDSKYNQLPVRATYDGLVQKPDGSLAKFNEVHNYYDFRPNVVSEEFFQTPTDLVCKNRKPTKPVPKLGIHFRVSKEESVNGFTHYLKGLIYDGDRNMVRIDSKPITKDPQTFYVTDPLETINDYNIGVSFNYNKKLRNCSIIAIPAESLDEDTDYTSQLFNSTSSYIIKLRSPEALLGLDSDYIYTGSRVINDIPGDNFVSDRSNISGFPFTTEYVFTSDDYGFIANGGLTLNVPYTFLQRAPEKDYFSYSTIYNFDQDELRFELFDVSTCFPKKDRIEIRFKFPYKGIISPEDLNLDDQTIRFEMYVTLRNTLNETWTRFSAPKVSISDDGNLYVRTAILPSPPSLTFFTLVPGKWLITPALSTQYNVESVSVCATKCLANIQCLSFDYSKSSRTCFLNRKHGSEADLKPSSYEHYSRNTMDGFYSLPPYALWSKLLNMTKSSQISLVVPSKNGFDSNVRLTATDIDQLADDDNRFGTTSILSKYNRAQPNKRFANSKDTILFGVNVDDCARACSEDLNCQSFDFCYIPGDCRLSNKSLSEISTYEPFVDELQCDIYEKDNLFQYTEFPGKATVNKKDKMYQAISPHECAKKCDNEIDLHCRSFNYCPDKNSCFLSETHLLDASEASTTDLICTHYSRNYLADFTFTSSANISLVGNLVFDKSSAEECARVCVTADGFNCKHFNFCPGTRKCLIYSDNSASIKPTNETDLCSNYIREYFYVTSTKVNTVKSDASPTVLTALAIVFAAFGLAVGAVLSYFYVKKRKL